jgi:arylformamidase
MDELVRQCRAAVTWIHRNAPSFGGDPARIFVSGHSAGGHLVAMLLATDWPRFAGLPADVIKGGAGISGLYDLEPIRLCYLNDTLKLTPETARRNSPVHLTPVSRAPLLLPLGGDEGPEYHRQTEDLAAAWRKQRAACEVMDMAGHNHFSIVALLEDPASALSRAILRQMGLGR